MKKKFFCLLFGSLCLGGCNFRNDWMGSSNQRIQGESRFATIQRTVLETKCAHCHSGSSAPKGIDLTSYANVMKSGAVVAFEPKKSLLYMDILIGKMPPKNPLGPEVAKMVAEWISQGALEKDPAVPPPPPPPPPKPVASFAWIKKYVFDTNCKGCHQGKEPKGDVLLTSYDDLMDSPGKNLKPIVAGDMDQSGVYDQVSSKKMPPDPAEKLSPEVIKVIGEWINNGANND